MGKKMLTLLMAACVGLLFTSPALYAGTEVDDVIKMQTKEYAEHKKGIVEFTHKKHAEDYDISCGECHHDAEGKPLTLKMGDNVQRCVECHKETEKVRGEKISKEEKIIKYHEEAIHANCITCHKEHNISLNDPEDPRGTKGPAPASCAKCHPRN